MTTSATTRASGTGGTTRSRVRRRLMTPDEIRRMRRGQILAVCSNVAPILAHNTPYFKRRALRRLVRMPRASEGQNTPQTP